MQYPVIFLCQMPWSVSGVAGAVPGRCKVIFLQTLALLPAGMSGWLSCTVQHWTLPHLSQGNTLPNLLDLFEGGVGLSWPGDKKKANTERENCSPVLFAGWFALAVSSVLITIFCCDGETALPSPWTTLCQQEILTHEIKCNICLKWLNKESASLWNASCACVWSATNTNIFIFTFLFNKISNTIPTRTKQFNS